MLSFLELSVGRLVRGTIAEPLVPDAIANQVQGILGLNSFLKPEHYIHTRRLSDSDTIGVGGHGPRGTLALHRTISHATVTLKRDSIRDLADTGATVSYDAIRWCRRAPNTSSFNMLSFISCVCIAQL